MPVRKHSLTALLFAALFFSAAVQAESISAYTRGMEKFRFFADWREKVGWRLLAG